MNVPLLWGHSVSIGFFLYSFEGDDLYLAGTINQTELKIKPFMRMGKTVRVLQTKNDLAPEPLCVHARQDTKRRSN